MGVKALVLYSCDGSPRVRAAPSAQEIPKIFQWVCWAADLPRLRQVEVRNGYYKGM